MTRGLKHVHEHWHRVNDPDAFGRTMLVMHEHEHYHSHASASMKVVIHLPHRHTAAEERELRHQQLRRS